MGDFLKNALKAPINFAPHQVLKKREGQPYLQGTARNIGHAAFGDDFAGKFEHKYLSDTAQGNRYASSDKPLAPVAAPGSGAGGPGMGFSALTQTPGGGNGDQGTPSPQTTEEIMRRMAQLMAQSQGSGFMTSPQVM